MKSSSSEVQKNRPLALCGQALRYSLRNDPPAPLPNLKTGPRAFAFTAICNGYDEIRGRVM